MSHVIENTCFLHMQKPRTKVQISCADRAADQRLCFCNIVSTIPLLPKFRISSLYLSSVSVQLCLCGTWAKAPKTSFLMMQLMWSIERDKVQTVFKTSLVMRKPAFCICKNKDPDQLRRNPEADQRLCFRYLNSTIPLLPKSEILSF